MCRFARFTVVVVALSATFPTFAQDKPILAVMGIEDKTGKLERKDLEAATELLSVLLAVSGQYSVVERGKQDRKRKEVVRQMKRESYDQCYDDKCRVELGRALAADTLVLCSVLKLGESCSLACRMVPLEKETAEGGGVVKFDCTATGLAPTLESMLVRLLNPATPRVSPSSSAVATYNKIPITKEAGDRIELNKPRAKHLQKMGMKAMKGGNCPLAIKYYEMAKTYTDKRAILEKLIEKCQR